MERKFKHKKTGWIATPLGTTTDLYKYNSGQIMNSYINLSLLENACDWEEIIEKPKQPTFTTYDGVELFGGETIYGVTHNFNLVCTSILAKEDTQTWKIFAEKTKAEEYIKQNEPKYSLKDVEDAMSGGFYESFIDVVLAFLVANKN